MKKWTAKLKNGEIISDNIDNNEKWNKIKNQVTELYFNNDNQIIILPKNTDYDITKTASVALGGDEINIESRNLMFKVGNKQVILRINNNNNILIEIL